MTGFCGLACRVFLVDLVITSPRLLKGLQRLRWHAMFVGSEPADVIFDAGEHSKVSNGHQRTLDPFFFSP